MTSDHGNLVARVERLERAARRTRLLAATAGIALLATWLTGASRRDHTQAQGSIRTKLLVVEDAQGRDRIVLGAPLPDGRARSKGGRYVVPWRARGVRSVLLHRRASRPQLKRDPLGGSAPIGSNQSSTGVTP